MVNCGLYLFLSPEGCRRVLTPRCSMLSHLQKEQSPRRFELLSSFRNDDQSLVGLSRIPLVECRINHHMLRGHKLKLIIKRTKYNYDTNYQKVKKTIRLSFCTIRSPGAPARISQLFSNLTMPKLFGHHTLHDLLNHQKIVRCLRNNDPLILSRHELL